MSSKRIRIGAVAIVAVALLAVAAVAAVVPGGTPQAKADGAIVLTVKHNGAVVKTYALTDLEALTTYSGYAGFITTGGTVHGPDPVTGVSLVTVLHDAGFDLTASQSVDVLAPDAFGAPLSYNQVVNGTPFDIMDAGTGVLEAPASTLTSILVYKRNGLALDPFDSATGDGEGPLRFYVAQLTDTNQVMDGSASVAGVSVLNVRDQAITEWKLKLIGLKIRGTRQIVTETRNSVEGCATPNCHKSGWTARDGRAWTGVPLWRLMGVVDGGARHKDRSYNVALARRGYRIRLFNAAGKYVTIGSRTTIYRDKVLLANLVAGAAPAVKYYPLRFVGPARYVPASKRLGRIVKIKMLPSL